MKKVYLVNVLVCISSILVSCQSVHCTRKEAFILKASAKVHGKQMILPVNCDRYYPDNNAIEIEGNTSVANWVCRESALYLPEADNNIDNVDGEKNIVGLPYSKEPRLDVQIPGLYSAYRFGWAEWRRGHGESILLRLEFSKNGRFLLIKRQKQRNCEDEINIVRIYVRKISEADWKEFERILERHNFWSAPDPEEDLGRGGSSWSLEGRKGEKFNRIDQWAPDKEKRTVLREAGEFLMHLAGYKRKLD